VFKRSVGLRAGWRVRGALLLVAAIVTAWWGITAHAQDESGGIDAGSCTLQDHVYSCNSAAFQPILMHAKTVAVSVHNADGVARSELTSFVTRSLGKTIAQDGTGPDLIFLLIPIEPTGIAFSTGDTNLGTLRVYSVTADGRRGHLLWAETYEGATDLPWPAVVHGLILQFKAHFRIR
jgi:hypothetical protein